MVEVTSCIRVPSPFDWWMGTDKATAPEEASLDPKKDVEDTPTDDQPKKPLRERCCLLNLRDWRVIPAFVVTAVCIGGLVMTLLYHNPNVSYMFGAGVAASIFLIFFTCQYRNLQSIEESANSLKHENAVLQATSTRLETQVAAQAQVVEKQKGQLTEHKELVDKQGEQIKQQEAMYKAALAAMVQAGGVLSENSTELRSLGLVIKDGAGQLAAAVASGNETMAAAAADFVQRAQQSVSTIEHMFSPEKMAASRAEVEALQRLNTEGRLTQAALAATLVSLKEQEQQSRDYLAQMKQQVAEQRAFLEEYRRQQAEALAAQAALHAAARETVDLHKVVLDEHKAAAGEHHRAQSVIIQQQADALLAFRTAVAEAAVAANPTLGRKEPPPPNDDHPAS